MNQRNQTDYRCKHINICSDTKKYKLNPQDKDLANQFEELCLVQKITGGPCLLYDEYEKREMEAIVK